MTNKIIKVTGCHECGFTTREDELDHNLIIYCEHPDMELPIVKTHVLNKTMQDNCPLDDEVDIEDLKTKAYNEGHDDARRDKWGNVQ